MSTDLGGARLSKVGVDVYRDWWREHLEPLPVFVPPTIEKEKPWTMNQTTNAKITKIE